MTNLLAHVPLQGTPAERATQFIPVAGGGEASSATHLLVAAYLLMWAALIGFLWLTWRRQVRIEEKLATLDKAVRNAMEKT